jgi:hypothetical protein
LQAPIPPPDISQGPVPSLSGRHVTPDEAVILLTDISTLLSKRFAQLAEEEGEDNNVTLWSVDGVKRGRDQKLLYGVLYDGCDEAIPMDAEGLKTLVRSWTELILTVGVCVRYHAYTNQTGSDSGRCQYSSTTAWADGLGMLEIILSSYFLSLVPSWQLFFFLIVFG